MYDGKDFDYEACAFAVGKENWEELMLEFSNRKEEMYLVKRVSIGYLPVKIDHLNEELNECLQLLELSLIHCDLNEKDCLKIARNPKMVELKRLNLSYNPIGIQGLVNLMSLDKDFSLFNLE